MGKLNVWLQSNRLTEDPNDYFGQVKSAGTLTLNGIVDRMVSEGIEMKRETLVDVLTRSERIKIQSLAEGYSINTPSCYARPAVQGNFIGAAAQYTKGVQKVVANFMPGKEMRDVLTNAQVDVLGVATTGPVIGEVLDTLTGDLNSTLTPNNVLKIKGDRIRILGENAGVGVWFINQADQTRTQMLQLISNNPSELLGMIPALPPGDYELEIVTQFSGGGVTTKEPRSVVFDKILIVA